MEEKRLFEDSDEFLVKQIESILKENNIPYVRRDAGAGSYMNVTYGQSFGLSKAIYVSNEDFEKAQNAIEVFNDQDFSEEDIPEELKEIEENTEEEIKANEKYELPKKVFKTYLIISFGVMAVFMIIGLVVGLSHLFT